MVCDQQHQHPLEAGYKCRFSGTTQTYWNQNLCFPKNLCWLPGTAVFEEHCPRYVYWPNLVSCPWSCFTWLCKYPYDILNFSSWPERPTISTIWFSKEKFDDPTLETMPCCTWILGGFLSDFHLNTTWRRLGTESPKGAKSVHLQTLVCLYSCLYVMIYFCLFVCLQVCFSTSQKAPWGQDETCFPRSRLWDALFKGVIEGLLSGKTCNKGKEADQGDEDDKKRWNDCTRLNLSLILWRALECERHPGIVTPEGKCWAFCTLIPVIALVVQW